MRGLWRILCGSMLVVLVTQSTGCVSDAIAVAFTNPPNGGRETVDPDRPTLEIYDAAGQLNVPGPPEATLAYWVMEPAPAKVSLIPQSPEATATPPRHPGWRSADAKYRKNQGFVRTQRGPADTNQPAVATVIVLHGWASKVRSSDTLWHLSATLADAGCRVILPDLRGHGDSTGEYVTSGYREVEDLSALLDHIQQTYGQADAPNTPVGVIGHSYGGGIAIQFAAHDPRVERVVGLAPLADIRPAMLPGVRMFARRFRPISWFFYLNWAIDQKAITEAQQKMEERTGADLAKNNALYRVQKVHVPVLILQGGQDDATPLAGAERLRDANPEAVELVVYPEAGHTSFLRDDFDDVEARLRTWVDGLTETSTADRSAQTKSVSRR
ncbi:MAG: alpha/beta fold hydrolase [Planctomycetota bacterium]